MSGKRGGEEEEMKKKKYERKSLDYKWFWFHPSEHPVLIHSELVSNWK